jgi:prolyl-tRNA synthetase
MQLSKLAFKPQKQAPKDADTINHRLLVQAGFVRQLHAGVYSYLPLGLKVLEKIRGVIRSEMNAIGGQEIHMPALHPKANWETTGGWNSIDVLFKLTSRTGKDYALGQSHEEIVTPLAGEVIQSYKDLPLSLYQIQWKFRDELRAKSGILRGREFEMKDMYSFHETQEDFDRFYGEVKDAYIKAYQRIGLTAKVTEASGGAFTQKVSYEFMVLTDAGEDDILYCDSCDYCINMEIAKTQVGDACPKCGTPLKQARASEVGNVFDLGQKYAKDFGVSYTDRNGGKSYPIMGCYGWGTTRTMGVLVEKSHDDRGIIWPQSISPFDVHIVTLDNKVEESKKLYMELTNRGLDVLWDDRDISAGGKFADADLIGIPHRIVISNKTTEMNLLEYKNRSSSEPERLSEADLIKKLDANN